MTLLIGLAIRSSVILAAGLLLSACLAKRSAALRHRVLVASLLAAALVMPSSMALPSWNVMVPAGMFDSRPVAAPALPVEGPGSVAVAPGPGAGSSTLQHRPTPSSQHPATSPVLPLFVIAWLTGVLIAAGALIVGLVRVSRVAACASRVEDRRWLQILDTVAERYGLRRDVVICRTDSRELLGTWGIRRPQVLLPHHAHDWTLDRVHVVLCHELAHIRRHDWLVQMSAETLRAILWFNPLAWMVCTRLRRESEQACDDEVLGIGVGGRDYAAHLLELARLCRRPGSTWASVLPMAHPSTLERRIAAMLNPRLDRQTPSRRAIAALTVVLLLVTLPVAALRARQASAAPPAETIPDATGGVLPDVQVTPVDTPQITPPVTSTATLVTPPVTVRRTLQAGPAPLSGTVYDVTGGVMPGVEVTLVDANEMTWATTSNASGRFEFPVVGPGKHVLHAKLPGFRSLRHEFELRNARDWNRAITLQVGELTETVIISASRETAANQPAAAESATEPVRIRVGGNVRAPLKEVHVSPVYPAAMREAGLTGVVPIHAVIGVDGSVSSVRVLSAQVHPDFAIATVDAVRQWRFTPTLLNGVPVEVALTVSVRFDLKN